MVDWWVAGLALLIIAGQLWAYRRLHGQLDRERAEVARLQRTLSFFRNELAEVQTRRKRLLAASTQALIIVEKDYHVSSANKVARRLFGRVDQESTFIEWTRQHQLSELVDQALEGRKMPPVYFARGDRILEAHARSIKIKGRVEAVALAIHDVTELQRLSRAWRDFVTNISHELRTPLASIRLLTETLLNGALNDSEMAFNLTNKIAAQAETMSQLAQELLDLSLIESGQAPLKLAPSPLQTVVQERVEALLLQAERKNLSLTVDMPADLVVLIDEMMIGRVVTNLIHNAIKFTETGGVTISARLYVAAQLTEKAALAGRDIEGTWAMVSVADTGIGIPPDEINRIFERFYKVDRVRKRPQAGTGLGLAIAKHIVEAHGGSIWAESEGKGATFHFTLPVDEIPQPA